MKINMLIASFILIVISAAMVCAVPANIVLKSPANGKEVTSPNQDFIFSFDQYANILNCSLIIDNAVKSFRNTLFNIENNKMSATMDAGSHSWYVSCYDSDFNNIVSEKNTLSVKAQAQVKEGYEIVYNNNGVRSYIITPAAGQAPVVLPAMKLGEDIRITILGKINYIDLLRMGSSTNTSFIEFRDRTSGKIYRLLIGESKDLDFNNDNITDIQLTLVNVDRGVDAYFKVIPYPGIETISNEPTTPTTIENTNVTATPAEPIAIENETGSETPAAEIKENITNTNTEEQPSTGIKEEPAPQTGSSGNKNISPLLIIVIIIVVIIAILLTVIKPNKKSPAAKSKSQQKEVKKVTASENKKLEEKPQIATPKDDSPKKDIGGNQDIDIIKSVGKKRR